MDKVLEHQATVNHLISIAEHWLYGELDASEFATEISQALEAYAGVMVRDKVRDTAH